MTTRRGFLQGAVALASGLLLPGAPPGWKRKSFRTGYGAAKVQGIVYPEPQLGFYACEVPGGIIGFGSPEAIAAYANLFDNNNRGPGSFRYALTAADTIGDPSLERNIKTKAYQEARARGLSTPEALVEAERELADRKLAASPDPMDRLKLIGKDPRHKVGVGWMMARLDLPHGDVPNRNGDSFADGVFICSKEALNKLDFS